MTVSVEHFKKSSFGHMVSLFIESYDLESYGGLLIPFFFLTIFRYMKKYCQSGEEFEQHSTSQKEAQIN